MKSRGERLISKSPEGSWAALVGLSATAGLEFFSRATGFIRSRILFNPAESSEESHLSRQEMIWISLPRNLQKSYDLMCVYDLHTYTPGFRGSKYSEYLILKRGMPYFQGGCKKWNRILRRGKKLLGAWSRKEQQPMPANIQYFNIRSFGSKSLFH